MASIFKKKRKRNAVYWIQYTDHLGIPYENEEGIADFHAAGRHTHITQLLRSGASITEARELARHTDVRMTMKYTHIGMADQARALAGLPSPQVVAGEEALHMRCICAAFRAAAIVVRGQKMALATMSRQKKNAISP